MRRYNPNKNSHQPVYGWLGRVERLTGTLSFRTGMAVFTVAAVFMYVFQVNTVTAKGYAVSEFNKKIKVLEEDNRKLGVSLAQEQSLERLSERVKTLNFVPADHIEYASTGASVLAKR